MIMSSNTNEKEIAVLAGGCFWCIEAVYKEVIGVLEVDSGYTGGMKANPTYEEICTGKTGHAEAVRITFDPSVISYDEILRVFFRMHDPTTMNRQGADFGSQYRSAIFYLNDLQRNAAVRMISEIENERNLKGRIVTEVKPLGEFHIAEEYHQDYFERNPSQAYCRAVIAPKVAKMRAK